MQKTYRQTIGVCCAAILLFSACDNPVEDNDIPLPSLKGTEWCWADRAQGSITVKEFIVESVDENGVQHGHLKCYRPFDPNQQVYDDWYYYDPVTKTGAIEYLTEFYILPDNSRLILYEYANYGHGAVFDRVGI